jgi:hypothetical protein
MQKWCDMGALSKIWASFAGLNTSIILPATAYNEVKRLIDDPYAIFNTFPGHYLTTDAKCIQKDDPAIDKAVRLTTNIIGVTFGIGFKTLFFGGYLGPVYTYRMAMGEYYCRKTRNNEYRKPYTTLYMARQQHADIGKYMFPPIAYSHPDAPRWFPFV